MGGTGDAGNGVGRAVVEPGRTLLQSIGCREFRGEYNARLFLRRLPL